MCSHSVRNGSPVEFLCQPVSALFLSCRMPARYFHKRLYLFFVGFFCIYHKTNQVMDKLLQIYAFFPIRLGSFCQKVYRFLPGGEGS